MSPSDFRTFHLLEGQGVDSVQNDGNWGSGSARRDVVPEELQGMLKPFPTDRMRAYKISSRVNSVKNDDAAVLDPV